jgi:hypothetical protein
VIARLLVSVDPVHPVVSTGRIVGSTVDENAGKVVSSFENFRYNRKFVRICYFIEVGL